MQTRFSSGGPAASAPATVDVRDPADACFEHDPLRFDQLALGLARTATVPVADPLRSKPGQTRRGHVVAARGLPPHYIES